MPIAYNQTLALKNRTTAHNRGVINVNDRESGQTDELGQRQDHMDMNGTSSELILFYDTIRSEGLHWL